MQGILDEKSNKFVVYEMFQPWEVDQTIKQSSNNLAIKKVERLLDEIVKIEQMEKDYGKKVENNKEKE